MLPLGTLLPIELLREQTELGSLQPVVGTLPAEELLKDRPVLVLFLCAHCPFVKHIEAELTRLQVDLGDRVAILAISSNSTLTHPEDGPEALRMQAKRLGWSFPYLLDTSQVVAKAFQAACTPDIYLFDADHRLAYRGQLDGSRPGNAIPLDGRDLRAAIAALLRGQPAAELQQPSIGCNIKWHPGAVPDWA